MFNDFRNFTAREKLVLALWGVVFAMLLCSDRGLIALPGGTAVCRYVALLLCLLLAFLIYRNRQETRDWLLATAALTVSLFGDFLFLFSQHWLIAISIFMVVQIINVVRFRFYGQATPWPIGAWWRILRLPLIGGLALLVLFRFTPSMSMVGGIYAVFLFNALLRAIGAWRSKRFPHPNGLLVVWGMILFFVNDLFVGLAYFYATCQNMPLSAFGMFMAWLLYVPAHLLLILSSRGYLKISRT